LTGLANVPAHGPVIYVTNHVGEQDGLLVAAAIIPYTRGQKIYTIAKWKILRFPLWKKWLGIIPLYPDRLKTIQETTRLLNHGHPILIFPEGGVNTDKTIGKVKTGAARIALATRTPIVPIGLRRTSPPPKTELGYVMEIFFGRLDISIGSPIDLSAWYGKTVDWALLRDLNQHIMSRVAELAGKTYQPPR
jgi:1-acyl-sn-glycerol-3-phosphate acyltransferase